jgi:hypothetical protein
MAGGYISAGASSWTVGKMSAVGVAELLKSRISKRPAIVTKGRVLRVKNDFPFIVNFFC